MIKSIKNIRSYFLCVVFFVSVVSFVFASEKVSDQILFPNGFNSINYVQSPNLNKVRKTLLNLARSAVSLNENNYLCQFSFGLAYYYGANFDLALNHSYNSIKLNKVPYAYLLTGIRGIG